MKNTVETCIICFKVVEGMNRIKELRIEKGMKQDELAAALSVKRQAVSKYETGSLDLGTDTVKILCELFGVTADYLLGFSIQRTSRISDADAVILDAYHAADEHTRQLVDLALRPFFESGNIVSLARRRRLNL